MLISLRLETSHPLKYLFFFALHVKELLDDDAGAALEFVVLDVWDHGARDAVEHHVQVLTAVPLFEDPLAFADELELGDRDYLPQDTLIQVQRLDEVKLLDLDQELVDFEVRS